MMAMARSEPVPVAPSLSGQSLSGPSLPGLRAVTPMAVSVPAGAGDLAARIAAGLAPLSPALILLFGMPAEGLAALGRALQGSLAKGGHVIGCSSAGEIGPGGPQPVRAEQLGLGAEHRVDLLDQPGQRRQRPGGDAVGVDGN